MQIVIASLLQAAVQAKAEPVNVSVVQTLLSSQSSGQSPSQDSPASTTPSPQNPLQSVSTSCVQPIGQQPSPDSQIAMSWFVHSALQFSAQPTNASLVHTLPSSQVSGHSPSQISPTSTTPLPQDAEQSLSLSDVQPSAQQPSRPAQVVMGLNTH